MKRLNKTESASFFNIVGSLYFPDYLEVATAVIVTVKVQNVQNPEL